MNDLEVRGFPNSYWPCHAQPRVVDVRVLRTPYSVLMGHSASYGLRVSLVEPLNPLPTGGGGGRPWVRS